jgi:hypothetical protein
MSRRLSARLGRGLGKGEMTSRVMRTWLMLSLAGLVGCAVRFISTYDDTTDHQVTQLQRSVDSFLRSLARNPKAPGCTYEKHQSFYDSTSVALGSLTIRNRARDKNQITVQQLELLDSSVTLLERLHRIKGDSACLSPDEIEPLRANFNTSFSAILRLELAKKRG